MARPNKYSTKAKLQKKTNAYFTSCNRKKTLPNKAGLVVYLGVSREWISRNGKTKKFQDTIRGAHQRIEDAWISRLAATGATGAIFYLKNAFKDDFKDRHNFEHTGNLNVTTTNYGKKKDASKPAA